MLRRHLWQVAQSNEGWTERKGRRRQDTASSAGTVPTAHEKLGYTKLEIEAIIPYGR